MWKEDYYFKVCHRLQYEDCCAGNWDMCPTSLGSSHTGEPWYKWQVIIIETSVMVLCSENNNISIIFLLQCVRLYWELSEREWNYYAYLFLLQNLPQSPGVNSHRRAGWACPLLDGHHHFNLQWALGLTRGSQKPLHRGTVGVGWMIPQLMHHCCSSSVVLLHH